MKIKIFFYDENITWDKSWIFLGSSFKNLKFAEKRISGKRIQINKFIHQSCKEEINNYLQWTEAQRLQFNDSIYWWMNALAGRNNVSSIFFLYICQIKSLKKILSNLSNSKEKEILIISDDTLLIKAIEDNLKEYSIIKSNYLFFKTIKSTFKDYYKIIRNFVICILDIFVNFFCAKVTLKEKKLPEGNVYLLHQRVEYNSLTNNQKIKSRYFPNLKEHFLKKNINLYCLTWFNPFWFGKLRAFKKLRAENSLIPEDWVNINDYLASIKNYLKAIRCIEDKTKYPKINAKFLLLRERRSYLQQINSNLRFWIYIPAIKKWSINCQTITCIDHYENMLHEHALIAAVRNLDIKTRIYGYHHTLSSKEFAPWHSLKDEWSSKFKPDFVISLGDISRKMLTSQGNPGERIINGPALRYGNIISKEENINEKNNRNILVPLSQVEDASYEVLNSIKLLGRKLENTDYIFTIKPHPNLNISKILIDLELRKLPNNIIISNENINKLLNNSLFTIFMSTAAAYDAVLNGNLVLNLKSELNLSDNYLDIFENEFKFVNAYSLDAVEEILTEFIRDKQKINNFIEEFTKLRKYLSNGLGQINEVNLSKFEFS